MVGKILTIQHTLVKFVRLFHHQSFTLYSIPYSGKVWWGKSLAKLAKLQVIRQLKPAKPARRPLNHRHSPNFSSPKLLDAQFAKLFPHQIFPLYGIILLVTFKAINSILLVSHPHVQQKQRRAGGDYWLFLIQMNQCKMYLYKAR